MYPTNIIKLPTKAERFYKNVLRVLNKANADYLIGGSLALAYYMHLPRRPKDLDIFVKREDCEEVLGALEKYGYETEIVHPHWLAKAYKDEYFIDFIFSSGNGIAQVDDEWFKYARQSKMLGLDVLVCAPEEILWSKAFIMDRDRFDGADIAHLIRDASSQIDWERLLERFQAHWQVLLTHLLLFSYIYPGETEKIPRHIVEQLMQLAQNGALCLPSEHKLCKGTLLSRDQYQTDVEMHGYGDGRVVPHGRMTDSEINEYTALLRSDKERDRLEKEKENLKKQLADHEHESAPPAVNKGEIGTVDAA